MRCSLHYNITYNNFQISPMWLLVVFLFTKKKIKRTKPPLMVACCCTQNNEGNVNLKDPHQLTLKLWKKKNPKLPAVFMYRCPSIQNESGDTFQICVISFFVLHATFYWIGKLHRRHAARATEIMNVIKKDAIRWRLWLMHCIPFCECKKPNS